LFRLGKEKGVTAEQIMSIIHTELVRIID
jgi:hypothetical protein